MSRRLTHLCRRGHGPAIALLAVTAAGCQNAGGNRVLAIDATGEVNGIVYFDLNGTRNLEGAVDVPLGGVRVELSVQGSDQVVASATSGPSGQFRMAGLPVGAYALSVDTSTVGDTALVARIDTSAVTLFADDSASVSVAVSFPIVTIADVRQLTRGTKVFVEGLALNGIGTFSDTTVHLSDTTGALRVTRVTTGGIFASDIVRMRGTVSSRAGQPTLDNAAGFVLSVGVPPSATLVASGDAATASGGTLDAMLVRLVGATIVDTAAVQADYRLTVDDGSGPVDVFLDGAVAFNLAPLLPDSTVDVTGLLVPVSIGTWHLKPRFPLEILVR